MELTELIQFAKDFSDMGDAVQEQLEDACDGRVDEVNPNALRIIRRWLVEVKRTAERCGDTELADDIESVMDDIDAHRDTADDEGTSDYHIGFKGE